MDIKEKFGNRLKQLRIAKNLSQEAVAHLADLDRTYISNIERGDRNVSIIVIEKLANALDVKIESFFEWREE